MHFFLLDSLTDSFFILSPEYCRNTEFESSEEEEIVDVNSDIFEEYELPSDDAADEKEHYSDTDSSVDVSIGHYLSQYSYTLGKMLLTTMCKCIL